MRESLVVLFVVVVVEDEEEHLWYSLGFFRQS